MLRRCLLVPSLLLIAACTPGTAAGEGSAVTTVYPLTWVVTEIAPDLTVTSLAARGQDPHDMELTPQQRAAVEQAALVVYLGDIGFQPQVEDAVAAAQGATVSAAEAVGADALRPAADEEHQGEQDEEPQGDHEEETTPEHPEQAADPHLWFDPVLMVDVARAVGSAAAQARPEQADTYRANAERVADELTELAGELESLLSDCRHREVVVGHEAFAYLLEPYGLRQRGISGAAGHSEASPHDVAELAAFVEQQGLGGVLSEPVEGRDDAEAVAREAGVDVIDIYSLDIVDEQQAAKGYPALLREQAQAVARAAGCPS